MIVIFGIGCTGFWSYPFNEFQSIFNLFRCKSLMMYASTLSPELGSSLLSMAIASSCFPASLSSWNAPYFQLSPCFFTASEKILVIFISFWLCLLWRFLITNCKISSLPHLCFCFGVFDCGFFNPFLKKNHVPLSFSPPHFSGGRKSKWNVWRMAGLKAIKNTAGVFCLSFLAPCKAASSNSLVFALAVPQFHRGASKAFSGLVGAGSCLNRSSVVLVVREGYSPKRPLAHRLRLLKGFLVGFASAKHTDPQETTKAHSGAFFSFTGSGGCFWRSCRAVRFLKLSNSNTQL